MRIWTTNCQQMGGTLNTSTYIRASRDTIFQSANKRRLCVSNKQREVQPTYWWLASVGVSDLNRMEQSRAEAVMLAASTTLTASFTVAMVICFIRDMVPTSLWSIPLHAHQGSTDPVNKPIAFLRTTKKTTPGLTGEVTMSVMLRWSKSSHAPPLLHSL